MDQDMTEDEWDKIEQNKRETFENADDVTEAQDADTIKRILKENPELAVEILQDKL